ncbi:hypothetical protein DSO57_1008192 [Entomophthora muscae]|uniref:Uncharacterized protein n=1 Tax=Entomophthora muscae TaxID=34485 RepID=A0ACC2U4W0_9FUNG|nr:hypothetical protein DSO57_1008192 [Entomophthora muscae]
MSDTKPLDNFNKFVANQSVVTQDLPSIPNLELNCVVEATQPIMADYTTHIEINAQNKLMETDSNVGCHNSSDIDQEYLNSQMETDSWEELPRHTNVPMRKSNILLKISEINNKVNELKESPKFRQKLTKAVSAFVPSQREELMLTNTGAPHAKELVNGVKTSIILDSGAYSNIISLKFLNMLSNIFVTPSNTIFVMADGHESFSMGTAKHLNLWLGSIKVTIDASIFDHQQYTLLLGHQTMSKLGVTTKYANNQWTIEKGNLTLKLEVTFESKYVAKFLCSPIAHQISKNNWLSKDQGQQLVAVIDLFSKNIVGDSDNLSEASGFKHEIDTGLASPIASRFY